MSASNKDKAHGRNYKKEYEAYQGTEEQKKNRAARNTARRRAERDGEVRKGDGKDVGHKKALGKGGSNKKSNWQVESKSGNRGFSRNSDGSMKSEKSKKGK